MKRSLAKKPSRKAPKAAVPAGRILEMRPVQPKKPFAPGVFLLALIAVGSLTACAFAFQKLTLALAFADAANSELAKTGAENADLKNRVMDFETLNALSKRTQVTALPSDLVWTEYISKNLSLRYPQGYEVIKASGSFPALTIKGDKGRVEIFRMKDFGGSREVDSGDNGLPQEALMVGAPLEQSAVQPYDAWIYYAEKDEQAKAIFDAIAASVKALR